MVRVDSEEVDRLVARRLHTLRRERGITLNALAAQTGFSAAQQQVSNGLATGFPAGAPFGPSGFIVNCPVVSLDVNISG